MKKNKHLTGQKRANSQHKVDQLLKDNDSATIKYNDSVQQICLSFFKR